MQPITGAANKVDAMTTATERKMDLKRKLLLDGLDMNFLNDPPPVETVGDNG